jgi:hypothetical protein
VTLTLEEVWIPTSNYSYRDPGAVTHLVLHTTEGTQRIRDLGYFFQGPVDASSHSGSDNYEQFVYGAYVDENDSAWTQANANPWCISLEQCTPEGAAYTWSRDYWLGSYERLLRNGAYWLACMGTKWDIPLTELSPSQAQNPGVRGVCQHIDLGSMGGGHGNCGPGYPMDVVLGWARDYQAEQPPPPLQAEDEDMQSVCIPAGRTGLQVSVSFNGAPYKHMGICARSAKLATTVTVLCQFHLNTGGWAPDVRIYADKGHEKVVITVPPGADGGVFTREDDENVDLYPDFSA